MSMLSLITCVSLLTLGFGLIYVAVNIWASRRPKRKRAEAEKEYKGYIEVCDACGKHPKQPNSQLCAKCEEKVNGKR